MNVKILSFPITIQSAWCPSVVTEMHRGVFTGRSMQSHLAARQCSAVGNKQVRSLHIACISLRPSLQSYVFRNQTHVARSRALGQDLHGDLRSPAQSPAADCYSSGLFPQRLRRPLHASSLTCFGQQFKHTSVLKLRWAWSSCILTGVPAWLRCRFQLARELQVGKRAAYEVSTQVRKAGYVCF